MSAAVAEDPRVPFKGGDVVRLSQAGIDARVARRHVGETTTIRRCREDPRVPGHWLITLIWPGQRTVIRYSATFVERVPEPVAGERT